jgi:hypothetical protein
MSKPNHEPPLDEDEPIPGSPRSRFARVVGLFLLILILAFLVWRIGWYSGQSEGASSIFGS